MTVVELVANAIGFNVERDTEAYNPLQETQSNRSFFTLNCL